MRENLTNACVFPLWLSSGVNSHAPLFFLYCSKLGVLGDTCGPVCPTVVFMEMGKGMKVTQNEHRRRTANYEQEEGWRGWRRRRLVSYTAAMCPLTPSSHSPAPLHPTVVFFFCSELFKMLCVLSFMFGVVMILCLLCD